MKTLTFIVALATGLLFTSCGVHHYAESVTIVVVDSTNMYEDYKNPGTFKHSYDTLIVTRIDKGNLNNYDKMKTVYKIKRKTKQCLN